MGEKYDLRIGMNFLSSAQKIIIIKYKKRLLTLTALKLRVSFPQNTYEGNKITITILKKYLHPHVHGSIIYNNQDMEMDERTQKMWCIHIWSTIQP